MSQGNDGKRSFFFVVFIRNARIFSKNKKSMAGGESEAKVPLRECL